MGKRCARQKVWFLSIFIFIVLMAAVLSVPAQATTSMNLSSRLIRGIYNQRMNISEAARYGFNLYYDTMHWDPQTCIEKIKRNSEWAAREGLAYVVGLYYSGTAPFDYVHSERRDGAVDRSVPSFVDPVYYEKKLEEPLLLIARLSLEYPIACVSWDTEFYGRDVCSAWSYSYDAETISWFCGSVGIDAPKLGRGEGWAWLDEKGLLARYREWQEQRAFEMARQTRKKVDEINPNLSVGFLRWMQSIWWNRAFAEGFNSPHAPTLLFDEQCYDVYDRPYVEEALKYIEEKELNAIFLPGFFPEWMPVTEMSENIMDALHRCGGYWIYVNRPYQIYINQSGPLISVEHLDALEYMNQSGLLRPTEHLEVLEVFRDTMPSLEKPLRMDKVEFETGVEAYLYSAGNVTTLAVPRPRLLQRLPAAIEPIRPRNITLSCSGKVDVINATGNPVLVERHPGAVTIDLSNAPFLVTGLSVDEIEESTVASRIKEAERVIEAIKDLDIVVEPEFADRVQSAARALEEGDVEAASSALGNLTREVMASVLVETVSVAEQLWFVPVMRVPGLLEAGEEENAEVTFVLGVQAMAIDEIQSYLLYFPLILVLLLFQSESRLWHNSKREMDLLTT